MKLQSMDVTIRGTTQTFEFDPPEDFGEGDEARISLAALEEAETTEVQLVGGFSEATVTVSYRVEYDGSVNVTLDVSEYDSYDDVQKDIERGEFDEVIEAIREDVERNIEVDRDAIDSVDDLEVTDENGDVVGDN